MDVQLIALQLRDAETLVADVVMPQPVHHKGDNTPAPLPIIIPLAAIANRRLVYGLDSDGAAIEAILREQAQRLGGLAPEGKTKAERLGGLRRDVAIKAAPEMMAALADPHTGNSEAGE